MTAPDMTPREPVPETTPRVGRWTSETTWRCARPCLSPNHEDRISCDACGCVRPPYSVGRSKVPAPSAPVEETGVSELEPEIVERAAREVYERDADVGTWPWTALPVLARANLMQYVRAGAALRSPRPVAGAQNVPVEALEAAYREGFEDGNVVDAPLASQGWRASETRRKATSDGAPSDE